MVSVIVPLLGIGILLAVGQGKAKPPAPEGTPAPSNVRGQIYPQINRDLTVTFRIGAANAKKVAVLPLDPEFGTIAFPAAKGSDGEWWVTTPPVVPGFHYYELIIDGVHLNDPSSETFFGWGRETSGLEVPDPVETYYEPQQVPQGQVRMLPYHSTVTGQWRRTYVYTPPGYDRGRHEYPVLYLQHGAGESERGWSAQGRVNFILDNLIAAKRAEPMLVVMDCGYAVDTRPKPDPDAFGAVVLHDLIPLIDKEFRTEASADARAIAGLSMGGGQAFNIGIHHLDRFKSIGVFSGAVRNFERSSGPLADAQAANRQIRLLWIGCGTDDGLFAPNEALHKELELAGIRHVWFTSRGAHVWQTWRRHLFEFAQQVFQPKPEITAGDLRCEYRREPLGLDVPAPRLSWKIEVTNPARRSVRQSGYRILVASDRASLDAEHGDLWDSGMVHSDASTLVEYVGKPLGSHQECWWKVRVRDESSRLSPWSAPAHWSMGQMHAGDWTGDWIGCADVFEHAPKAPNWITHENTVRDPWFRKEITLAAKPSRAVVYLASVGYQELYVNGVRAGHGVLEPGVTDNGKRARYETYDVTPLLKPGVNVLAIWLGVSWSIFPHFASAEIDRPMTPIALGQAEIWLPDGERVTVVTDRTWKTQPSPNKLLGVWDFMNYGGEEYDARLEAPGWNCPGFDDSRWRRATVYHPKLEISADNDVPNSPVRQVFARDVQALPDGDYRVDMGQNFAGWVQIPVHGEPGDRIDFEFSERAGEAMSHKLHSDYIIGPSGWGVFRNLFNYGVGRWITIKGLKTPPERNEVEGWLVRSDYDRAAEFECSNKLLNQIYDMTLWTFENLSVGGYVVDCPQRERMGYGGDGHATVQAGLANYDLGAFYTKWAMDWRDVQAADGNLPYTAPTYWGGGGPSWMGFCIFMPWQVYRQYGDVRILREEYPTVKRWLAFMESHAKKNLLVRWGGEWDFLGDWLWPGESGTPDGDTRETLCFNNCYWVYALRLAAKAADVLGLPDGAAYRKRADEVSAAINARFYDPKTHAYVTGDQTYQAAALLAGVPTEDQRPLAWKRLEDEILIHRKGYIHAGITGGALLTRLLLDDERADLMYSMAVKRDFPGWGDFIEKGHTTFPEAWGGGGSQLHSSYLFVGAWFIEGLAGINQGPEDAGFRHFELRPWSGAGPDLDRTSASYNSPYGRIACAWRRSPDSLEATVTVPPNSTATLVLPVTDLTHVTETGTPVKQAKGVSNTRLVGGNTLLDLGSGTYDFAIRQ